DLKRLLSVQHVRVVQKDNTVSFEGVCLQLPRRPRAARRGDRGEPSGPPGGVLHARGRAPPAEVAPEGRGRKTVKRTERSGTCQPLGDKLLTKSRSLSSEPVARPVASWSVRPCAGPSRVPRVARRLCRP